MKKVFRFGVLLTDLGVIFGPAVGQAFNPATHIYIAEKVCPACGPKNDYFYGAISPDLAMYVGQPEKWPTSFADTHYDFIDLSPAKTWSQKAFAKGWWTHNEIQGADFYAHGIYPYTTPGYVLQKAEVISSTYGVDIDLAHYLVETAVDLLVKKNLDPKIGVKLLNAVLFRSYEDQVLLTHVLVFGAKKTDWLTLASAELTFRNLTARYAMALSLPSPLDKGAIADLGVKLAKEFYGLDIDKATLLGWINFAMAFCSDYQGVLQGTINGIKPYFPY